MELPSLTSRVEAIESSEMLLHSFVPADVVRLFVIAKLIKCLFTSVTKATLRVGIARRANASVWATIQYLNRSRGLLRSSPQHKHSLQCLNHLVLHTLLRPRKVIRPHLTAHLCSKPVHLHRKKQTKQIIRQKKAHKMRTV